MTLNEIDACKAIPFLRWAGGKKWLIKEMGSLLPTEGFNQYHEPFLGGGAILFHLKPQKSFLNDLNKDLIETYERVRDDVFGVISELEKFRNTEKSYYEVRGKRFRDLNKKAAQFIFLNQTSFNGIYRVNQKGEYNVPYGHRKKSFLNVENLLRVSKALENAEFSTEDFSNCISKVKKNDLVFLDPPYTITHNNNGFFKYNKKLFSEPDQYRLSEFIDALKAKEAYYILTNAAHNKVRNIFDKGDSILELKRASLVGGVNANRGKYSEFVFTNCVLPSRK